CLQYSSVPPTF
nr:immunoglobulin light chain junction region [Macaca mulatta]MOW43484.1 immunoglobulin light chain junction region [Macaca mulatta]MOW45338.1 immunoglobulin light chain junction region [Macaca mulatta]